MRTQARAGAGDVGTVLDAHADNRDDFVQTLHAAGVADTGAPSTFLIFQVHADRLRVTPYRTDPDCWHSRRAYVDNSARPRP